MKKTLQKKLDDLGDRMKTKNSFKGEIVETIIMEGLSNKKQAKIEVYLAKKHDIEHSYTLQEKGRKYDALKKRNVELVELLKDLLEEHKVRARRYIGQQLPHWTSKVIKQALKNNDND